MTRISHFSFLGTILPIDAFTCVSMAMLLAFASDQIERWLSISATIQDVAIATLLPFAAFVLYAATRPQPPLRAGWLLIIGNISRIMASLGLLLIDSADFNLAGKAFIAVQGCSCHVVG